MKVERIKRCDVIAVRDGDIGVVSKGDEITLVKDHEWTLETNTNDVKKLIGVLAKLMEELTK